ncbi:MAG: TRAP transporter small permease subunit [Alphaproteobacteria bacterium]|jgi:TRAP-type C4-dicarboxylate transport system permease small subunit|nr:TRAP transporter small permease subunit [Alphaproteobacteria bacterium]
MLRALDRNAERWALLFFYILLVATMVVEVIRREVLSYSSIWGEELVRYSFIYLVWIGASAAIKDRAHIRIDVIFHALPHRGQTLLYLLGDLIMLAVAVAVVIWSWHAVGTSMRFGSVTDGLRVSKVYFLLAVPIGFSMVSIRLLQSIWRDLGSLKRNEPPFTGEKLFD